MRQHLIHQLIFRNSRSKRHSFDRFLQLIIEGGHSSFEFNQNAYSIKNPQEQGVPLALAISQKVLGLPVMAIYENGQMIDSVVKDDATAESIEAMILKHC